MQCNAMIALYDYFHLFLSSLCGKFRFKIEKIAIISRTY